MMIKLCPVEIEAYDELGDMAFKVECFDGETSSVEIKTLVTPGSWLELSAKVHEALLMVHPDKDGRDE